MNKVESFSNKKSILILNNFYGKIMTNFNYLTDHMIDYLTIFEVDKVDSKLILLIDSAIYNKEKFKKIYSLTSETKSSFQNFYCNFADFLKVKSDITKERRKRNLKININNRKFNKSRPKLKQSTVFQHE